MRGMISLLHKGKESTDNTSDWRPVVPLDAANQLLGHMVNQRLRHIVEKAGISPRVRRPLRSTTVIATISSTPKGFAARGNSALPCMGASCSRRESHSASITPRQFSESIQPALGRQSKVGSMPTRCSTQPDRSFAFIKSDMFCRIHLFFRETERPQSDREKKTWLR